MTFNTPTQVSQVPPRLPDTEERIAALEAALDERILVLDGATGTALQAANLTAADFGGPDLEGCNEMLCAVRPDVVASVHERYLRAGAHESRRETARLNTGRSGRESRRSATK